MGVDKVRLPLQLGQQRCLLLKMVATALNVVSVACQISQLGGIAYVFADLCQIRYRDALLAIQRLTLEGGCPSFINAAFTSMSGETLC